MSRWKYTLYSLFNSESVFITELRSDEQIVSKFKLAFENFLFVFYHSGRLNGVDNSFCAFECSKSTIIIPACVVVYIILSEVDYTRYNLYRWILSFCDITAILEEFQRFVFVYVFYKLDICLKW